MSKFKHDHDYIGSAAAGANMAANITGDWIDCVGYDALLLQASWDNTGSPTGTWKVQGRSRAPQHAANIVDIPLDRVMGPATPGFTHDAGDVGIVVAAAGSFAVQLTPLFDDMRLVYTAVAGTANTSARASSKLTKVQ